MTLTWEAKTKDGKFFSEANGDKFDLKWEEPDTISSFTLKNGTEAFVADFATGHITKNGTSLAELKKPIKLIYRKRTTLHMIPGQPPQSQLSYFLGFEAKKGKKLVHLQADKTGSFAHSHVEKL